MSKITVKDKQITVLKVNDEDKHFRSIKGF